ncbi:hypothetical protein P7C73_g3491, partial [Tremellales sp. Uapishka_1]
MSNRSYLFLLLLLFGGVHGATTLQMTKHKTGTASLLMKRLMNQNGTTETVSRRRYGVRGVSSIVTGSSSVPSSSATSQTQNKTTSVAKGAELDQSTASAVEGAGSTSASAGSSSSFSVISSFSSSDNTGATGETTSAADTSSSSITRPSSSVQLSSAIPSGSSSTSSATSPTSTTTTESSSDANSSSSAPSLGSSSSSAGSATSQVPSSSSATDSSSQLATSTSSAAQTEGTVASLDWTSSNGTQYTVDVTVGSDILPVVVDTGSAIIFTSSTCTTDSITISSSQFWVATSSCSSCSSSNMAVAESVNLPSGCSQWSLTYGKGSTTGCLYNTSIVVGGYSLPNYELLGVSEINSDFAADSSYMSGIWGVGLNISSINSDPTPVNLLYQQKQIASPMVGFYLARDEDSSSSELTLGDISSSQWADQSKQVTLSKVSTSNGLYQVQMDAIVVGGSSVPGSENADVYLDTGTTYILVPQSMLLPIYGSLGAGTYYAYGDNYLLPCTSNATTPTLSIAFGGIQFEVDYQDLITGPVESGSDLCYGSIQSFPDQDMWLFGDAFLHNVYHAVNTNTGAVTIYGLNSA